MARESLGRRNYEPFARRYAERSATKPHNAYYDRPATLSLLPELAGKRVLDAGCGPGHYAEALLARGPAELVCVDVTPAMVELTRARVGGGAEVLCADLEAPLPFPDGRFDALVCALVLDYLRDWDAVFAEFARVLAPGGVVVCSHSHPMGDWATVAGEVDPDSDYFARELYTIPWRGFGDPPVEITCYRRSLADMLNPLCAAGLVLERALEPKPTEDFRRVDPEGYAALMRAPVFLCLRARKPR